MKKVIFIVHQSEIVRRGLQSALRNYFNVETTLLNSLSELKAFNHMARTQIIIFAEAGDEVNLSQVHSLEDKNKVALVGISEKTNSASNPVFIHNINLATSGDEIQQLVSGILNFGSGSPSEVVETGELTLREKEVLKLVALGFANKEIADKLFISIHTVISHRKNITEKLGIKSISGLTVYAILNKIIDPETIDPGTLI